VALQTHTYTPRDPRDKRGQTGFREATVVTQTGGVFRTSRASFSFSTRCCRLVS
jgi:hypothetical protein